MENVGGVKKENGQVKKYLESKMSRRLFAFGCSNTYGEGLPDCWQPEIHLYGEEPSKLAWPQLLADDLNLECRNIAIPGCSNKHITNRMLNTDLEEKFTKDDTVVFLWTYFSRSCFFQEEGKPRRLMVADLKNPYIKRENQKWQRRYFKEYYTEIDSLIDNYTRFNFAKMYLDKKGIKNYHFTCHEPWDTKDITAPRWSEVVFPEIRFNFNLPRALDNMHPGIEAQREMASDILNYIKG